MKPSARSLLPVVACVFAAISLTTAPRPARADAAADDAKDSAVSVTLKLAPKEGEVHRYRSVARVSSPALGGADVEETTVARETVTKVAADGAATAETVIESRKATYNGMDAPGPDIATLPRVTATTDKAGNIVNYKLTGILPPGSSELQEALAYASSLNLPDRPLHPGDTWTAEVDNRLVKDKKVKSEFTYLGTEKVGEIEANKIKQVYAMDTPEGTLKTDFTLYLDPATGNKLKAVGTITDFPIPMLGLGTIKIEQTLVIADQDEKQPAGDKQKDTAGGKPGD
jgi:hypothetical protein